MDTSSFASVDLSRPSQQQQLQRRSLPITTAAAGQMLASSPFPPINVTLIRSPHLSAVVSHPPRLSAPSALPSGRVWSASPPAYAFSSSSPSHNSSFVAAPDTVIKPAAALQMMMPSRDSLSLTSTAAAAADARRMFLQQQQQQCSPSSMVRPVAAGFSPASVLRFADAAAAAASSSSARSSRASPPLPPPAPHPLSHGEESARDHMHMRPAELLETGEGPEGNIGDREVQTIVRMVSGSVRSGSGGVEPRADPPAHPFSVTESDPPSSSS